MPCLPYLPKSAMYCATGSFSRMRPSSTSFITLVVVATTLVSEARSKMVSSVIGSGAGATRALAERAVIDDCVAAADQHDRAGQFVAGDRGLDERRDRREIRRGSIRRRRRDLRREMGRRGERERAPPLGVWSRDSIYTEGFTGGFRACVSVCI